MDNTTYVNQFEVQLILRKKAVWNAELGNFETREVEHTFILGIPNQLLTEVDTFIYNGVNYYNTDDSPVVDLDNMVLRYILTA